MKRGDVKVTVTLGDVLHAPCVNAWETMCDKYGINEWCLNEGRADSDDTIEVSLEDAERWGINRQRIMIIKNK